MTVQDRPRQLHAPALSASDADMARTAQRCIMEALDYSQAAAIVLTTESGSQPSVAVPPAALRLIGQVLGALSEGRPVALVPADRELSTVETAALLNVSRPFVIKEIDGGRLPHRMVGAHRRIALVDALAYRNQMRARQKAALDAMADDARELGLDY